MKRTLLSVAITLTLAASANFVRGAAFTPIPLNPSSFNADPVIEATAPRSINDFVGVTPDAGTNKTGNTWYEMGYNTNVYASPTYSGPLTGLPHPGATFTAISNANRSFQMPPDYTTNNVIFVGHNNSTWSPILGPGTFTLTTPAAYSAISVLSGTGNGANTIGYTINHQDGTSETGSFSSPDWFSGPSAATAWRAGGLLGTGGGIQQINGNAGTMWMSDIVLANSTSPVTNIVFRWLRGNSNADSPWGNGRTFIFAVSGSTDLTTFTPIAVTGYDHDGIMEASGPKTTGTGDTNTTGTLVNDNTYISFTMDGGIWKNGNTWFEAGYYAAYPTAGVPAAGSTITSATEPAIQYTMPSSYVGNSAICLSSNLLSDTITFASPTAAGALSFLIGGGNGGLNLRVEIQYQGGGSETNWITAPDWFNRSIPWSYVCFGRVNPSNRSFDSTPDRFQNNWIGVNPGIGGLPPGQPFSRDPRNGGQSFPDLPPVRLYDAIIPVSNSGTPIASVNIVVTNTGTFGNSATIFAVSGNGGAPPVFGVQPFGLVTDSATGSTNATTGQATFRNIILTKGWQGTNNISLIASNSLGSGLSYQWKRAPRGGGWRSRFLNDFDMSTFVNVTGPNIGGATSNWLTISNLTLADSADYLLLVTNNYGWATSFVATVMVLTTNANILAGVSGGDTITHYTGDGTSANGQETFTSAIDQTQQKWLSSGVGGTGLDGGAVAQATVPFVGPGGYIVSQFGASIVNTIRFYCANDTPGRDPRDYTLEGSNDGGSTWSTITGGQLLGTLMLPVARDTGGTANALNPFTQPLTEVNFANATAYKSYRVTITNCMEPVATPLMQVAEIGLLGTPIPSAPVWVREPEANVTVFVGSSPTLGVQAVGYPTPRFQWYSNGVSILNATNGTYTFSNAQLSDSGRTFYCQASNIGGTTNSFTSTLTVISPPTQSYPAAVLGNSPVGYWRLDEADTGFPNDGVVTHDYTGGHNGYYSNVVLGVSGYNPASDLNTAAQFGSVTPDSYVENINNLSFARASNSPVAFSVEAWVFGANQTAPPGAGQGGAAIVTKGYNGVLAAGTGTGTEQFALDVTGAGTQANPSQFRFLVREASGQGDAAQSSVIPYDPILLQPIWHHLVGVCNQPAGQVLLYVDGVLAASATIATNGGILSQSLPMTIGARKSTQAADFDQIWIGTIDDVAIYNSALSASQVLAHYYAAQRPPLFSLQPVSIHTNDNTTAVFKSVAYGPGTVTYQWYNSDGVNPTTPIGGQTSSNYSFTATAALSGSFYEVVAANAYGSVTSAVVQLTVESGAPAFLWQDLPASQTVFVGHIIQLHVDPSGTAPFTYQWQLNGVNLVDNYRTAGSTTSTLTIGYATNSDSGNYACVVTGVGTGTSTTDALTVSANTAPFGSGGFFTATGAQSEWNLQGTTAPVFTSSASGATIQMTSSLGSTGRSAWLNTKQNISAFTASFVYQVTVNAGNGADGITFCIQNQSATALGGQGGSLSYDGITPSEAFQLNIYAPNTRGFGTAQNGTRSGFASLLPNIAVGDNTNQIRADMTYNGSVWSIKFTDLVTSLTFTTNITVNIPTIVGASTAWVGFTGADGGVSSTQVISVSKPAGGIFAIKVQMVGGNLVLTWPSSAGAFLQTTPSLLSGWTYDQTHVFRVVGTNSTVTVPPQGAGSFFRLQQFP